MANYQPTRVRLAGTSGSHYSAGLLRVRAASTPLIVGKTATTKTSTVQTAAATRAPRLGETSRAGNGSGSRPRSGTGVVQKAPAPVATINAAASRTANSALQIPRGRPPARRSREPQPRPPENPHVKMPWDLAAPMNEAKLNFFMGVPDVYPLKRPRGNF